MRFDLSAVLVFIFITCFFVNAIAQPGGGGPCPLPPCTPPVPIGGVELLLLAGGVLGVRKMLKKK